jgi:hypothetical protein
MTLLSPSVSGEAIRRYLRSRMRDLELLAHDTTLDPNLARMADDEDRGKLCIFVDWSEVFAFIAMTDPPQRDELVRVLGDKEGTQLSSTAHHTALSVLFERVARSVPLILLPPHLNECIHFLRLMRSRTLSAAVLQTYARRKFFRANADAELIRELEAELSRAKVSGNAAVKRAQRYLRGRESQVLALVKREFGALFAHARLVELDAFRQVDRLLSGQSGRRPRVGTLETVLEIDSEDQEAIETRAGSWRRQTDRWLHKRPGSRRQDARALAYLEYLVPRCDAQGIQPVFVTRDEELPRLFERARSRFGALDDEYFSASRPLAQHPTIYRSWRSFLELGIAHDDDPERVRTTIRNRLADVRRQLHEHSRVGDDAALLDDWRTKRSELAEAVQNQQQLIASYCPDLGDRRPSETSEFAIRLLVEFVTGDKFESGRSKTRHMLLQVLARLEVTIGDSFDPEEEGEDDVVRPLLRQFVSKLTNDQLLDKPRSTRLRQLLNNVRKPSRRKLEELSPWVEGISSGTKVIKGSPGASPERIAALFEYCVADFEGLEIVLALDPLPEVAPESPTGDRGWDTWSAMMRLAHADALICRGAHEAVYGVLENALRQAQHVWPRTSSQEKLPILGFYNAYLVFLLDLSNVVLETIHNLPPGPLARRGSELETVLNILVSWVEETGWSEQENKPSPLIRSIINNCVYTAARLVPLERDWAVPNWMFTRLRDQTRWIDDRSIARMVTYMDVRLRLLGAAERDTLAYWYIKAGAIATLKRSRVEFFDKAGALLASARQCEPRDRVTSRDISQHEDLLSRLLGESSGHG